MISICFLWYSSYIILYKIVSHYHLKPTNIMYFFPWKATLKPFQGNTVQQLVPIIIVKGILYFWFWQKCQVLGSVQNSCCLGVSLYSFPLLQPDYYVWIWLEFCMFKEQVLCWEKHQLNKV